MAELGAKKMMGKGSKVVENTIFLAVSGAGGLVFTLVQLGLLSRFLEGNTFGLFVTLRGFSLLLATLVLTGTPQVLIRFLPSYQSRGARGRAVVIFAGAFVLMLLLGYLLLQLKGIWSGWIPRAIRECMFEGDTLFWVVAASVTMAMKLLLYGGFNGLREMKMQMILELIYLAVFTGIIASKRGEMDIPFLFMVICILNACVFVAGAPVFITLVMKLIRGSAERDRDDIVLPSLVPYWGGAVLLSFIALAFTDVDRFVMSSMLPVSLISVFHVASRVNGILKRFLGFPVLAAQPEITRVYEEGRLRDLPAKINLLTKVTLVTSLLVAGVTAAVGRELIGLISGPGYAPAYGVLLFLLPAIPLSAVTAPILMAMRSLHYMKWAVLCDFLWMAVYFGCFAPLVSKWGIKGMALAQLMASAVQMCAAIILSKREGIYGGIGSRIYRVVIAVAVAVPLSVALTDVGGLPASILLLLLFPFACRLIIGRLAVFDPLETASFLDMVPVTMMRRAAAWILSYGGNP